MGGPTGDGRTCPAQPQERLRPVGSLSAPWAAADGHASHDGDGRVGLLRHTLDLRRLERRSPALHGSGWRAREDEESSQLLRIEPGTHVCVDGGRTGRGILGRRGELAVGQQRRLADRGRRRVTVPRRAGGGGGVAGAGMTSRPTRLWKGSSPSAGSAGSPSRRGSPRESPPAGAGAASARPSGQTRPLPRAAPIGACGALGHDAQTGYVAVGRHERPHPRDHGSRCEVSHDRSCSVAPRGVHPSPFGHPVEPRFA